MDHSAVTVEESCKQKDLLKNSQEVGFQKMLFHVKSRFNSQDLVNILHERPRFVPFEGEQSRKGLEG